MSAAGQMQGRVVGLVLGLMMCGLLPSVASADEGTVRLHDGGVVSGTIEIYEPGRRVVLRTASGETVTLTHEQIAELHITPSSGGPPPPPPSATVYAPPPAQPTPYPTEYQLSPAYPSAQQQVYSSPNQPTALHQQSLELPSLAAPAIMLVTGASLIAAGLWALTHTRCDGGYADEDRCDRNRLKGFVLTSVGGPLAFVGLVVVLPIQMGKRARRRAAYAQQLALNPVVDPLAGRYGLAGTLRF